MMDFRDLAARTGPLLSALFLPILLVGFIGFGGATRGHNIVIGAMELIACALLIWTINQRSLLAPDRPAWTLIAIFSGFVGVSILQLIPLPPDLWTELQGRETIVEAFKLNKMSLPWMPLSLAPQETFFALLQFLPPIAIFLLVVRSKWRNMSRYIDWFIPLIATLSVLLGFLQVMFPGVEDLFLHGQTVRGQALGIMQVVNHHATLLLMALPFLAVAVSRLHTRYELGDPDPAGAIMALLFSVVILAGIVASGSVAGYVLTAPVLFASGLIILGRQSGRVFTVAGLGIAVLFAGIAYMVASSPNLDGIGVTDLSNSPLSRRNIYATTIVAIQDHLPFGSGLGSFASLYPGYENGADIMPSFIAHAHNEYLEIALELGIPGILLLIAGCGWVTVTSVKAWRASQVEGGRLKKAASIGAFIVVLHCAVDFPIRTETIACLFAYCLGVLATKPGSGGLSIPPETENQARHRHVVI